MASVKAQSDVQVLMSELEQTDDPRLAVKLLRERIDQLSAEGKDIPEAYILLQNRLVNECVYASQGR